MPRRCKLRSIPSFGADRRDRGGGRRIRDGRVTRRRASAAAHTGTGLAGGFQSGFLHPFSGFDHLLAMISVGLWGAFLGRPLIVALPVIFPTVMAIGGVLGIAGVPLPPVEIGIAVSVLVLGAMIAGRCARRCGWRR